ncbi:Glyoxalase-like domain protein [Pseudovibrio axinellae]|uniref:Glyoxalase-like domain protein n=1 Tax=Pseudovibrio axinellae TaxID=989403 RepID=A0A166B7Z9_9HYPH|nr:VOC family protein [Pseudovibrio axinellae]KZL21999.1 Glyoxalase-like domain protein [Pseudovibrio axinellae]SEQ59291.1 hypothetical protein SAMN05421798_103176 [Pseudovibrio axinellae]
MAHPFHLAFPVDDLAQTKTFYMDILGCKQGREREGKWVDFDLFGHQMSAHLHHKKQTTPDATGIVDGDSVPVPHFGVVLPMEEWRALADRLKPVKGIEWVLEPKIRFEGQPGEQGTFFIKDPSGNALEFKGFTNETSIFAT